MNGENIRTALRAAGIAVLAPAAAQGVCLSPYTVVQHMGTYRYAQSNRLTYTLWSVHCYVPLSDYEALGVLVERVRAALAALAPDLRPTGSEGVHIVNDKFRAHETYLEYLVQQKT